MRITNHAEIRARQRFSWKRRTLDRMSRKVFKYGIKPEDTKSKLHKYIVGLQKDYPHANNIRVYGQDIYFFNNDCLITLYKLPQELIKYTKI